MNLNDIYNVGEYIKHNWIFNVQYMTWEHLEYGAASFMNIFTNKIDNVELLIDMYNYTIKNTITLKKCHIVKEWIHKIHDKEYESWKIKIFLDQNNVHVAE